MDFVTAEKIIQNQKTKFRCLNQVHDLTKEAEKCIDEGDVDTLTMVAEMRRKQLDICREMDAENEHLVKHLPPEERLHGEELIHHQEEKPLCADEIEKEIYTMTERIAKQLQITIAYDKKFTDRMTVRN